MLTQELVNTDIAASNDATKVAEALQKVLHFRKEHGTREEVLDALKLFLPESPYYALLSDLNPPDMTSPTSTTTFEAESLVHNSLPILQEIVEYEEAAERQAIQKEVEKRRQRLTTTTSAEETRKMVMREVMSKSRLPGKSSSKKRAYSVWLISTHRPISTDHGPPSSIR
jgi:superkiller protein 3